MHGLFTLVSLLRGQRLSGAALRRLQDRRLRRLVRHAYDRVPYYRRLLDTAGVDPVTIRGLDDLPRIPVTRKEDLQALPLTDITASGVDLARCNRSRTGGATGRPLEIVSSHRDRSAMNPSFIRAHLSWGLRPWDRLMFLEARPVSVRRRASWYEHLGLLRRWVLFSGDGPEAWIRQVRRWKPRLLQGYVLTLKLFAETVLEKQITDVRIPLVCSTSGVLDKAGRKLIESAFGAKVLDVYASHEAGAVIAWECPECNGYHMGTDLVWVEILRDGESAAPGEEGDVVITNLWNQTMPFIRYHQGDLAVRSEVRPVCGRPFPLMAEIRGRAGDYVVLPSGEKLSPHPFFLVLDDAVGVGEWQLVQTDLRHIDVRITTIPGSDSGIDAVIRHGLAELVGEDMAVEVTIVDSLRRDPYQKLRSVVSRVSGDPDRSALCSDADVYFARSDSMLEQQFRQLLPISRVRDVPEMAQVDDMLARAREEPMSLSETNLFVNAMSSSRFEEYRERVMDVSARLRAETFGNSVVPMAPVEVSNVCMSDCRFCGWRASNRQMQRLQISEDLVMEQVRYLVRKGIRYIEFVGGDDLSFVRASLPSLIHSARQLAGEADLPLKICFCTMSLTEAQYRELKAIGADSMIVWQETYDPACYRRQILGGPKAHGIGDDWRVTPDGDGYAFRLHAQERALEAGLEVALGTILGLNDNLNFEILATIAHARYLADKYPGNGQAPIIIGMPTWNAITTPGTDNRPAERKPIDRYFSFIACLYFLSLPRGRAWVFPNCRVGIEEQIQAVKAAGVFTSTEVKLGPGGYLPAVLAEMRANGKDTRELEALIAFETKGRLEDSGDLAEALDQSEQFVHHYHPHEVYMEKMASAGMRVLQSATLAPGPNSW